MYLQSSLFSLLTPHPLDGRYNNRIRNFDKQLERVCFLKICYTCFVGLYLFSTGEGQVEGNKHKGI